MRRGLSGAWLELGQERVLVAKYLGVIGDSGKNT